MKGLKVLIDTGCSHSLIHQHFCNENKKYKKRKNKYFTGSGTLITTVEVDIHFNLTEFSAKKLITWKVSVTDSENLGYDLILGRDLMDELKIDVLFSRKVINWEGIEIPICDFNRLQSHQISK